MPLWNVNASQGKASPLWHRLPQAEGSEQPAGRRQRLQEPEVILGGGRTLLAAAAARQQPHRHGGRGTTSLGIASLPAPATADLLVPVGQHRGDTSGSSSQGLWGECPRQGTLSGATRVLQPPVKLHFRSTNSPQSPATPTNQGAVRKRGVSPALTQNCWGHWPPAGLGCSGDGSAGTSLRSVVEAGGGAVRWHQLCTSPSPARTLLVRRSRESCAVPHELRPGCGLWPGMATSAPADALTVPQRACPAPLPAQQSRLQLGRAARFCRDPYISSRTASPQLLSRAQPCLHPQAVQQSSPGPRQPRDTVRAPLGRVTLRG